MSHRLPIPLAQALGRRFRALASGEGRAMSTKNPATTSNRLLSHLSASDFALLGPHLTRVDLPLRKRLGVRGKLIDSIYFPESGFLSIVADGHGDRGIEVGLVGREGMTGLAVVMGANRAP
ncbi:MAG TPA: hypothetical protein VGJ68_01400, partial [Bradyrhizobium sp.]